MKQLYISLLAFVLLAPSKGNSQYAWNHYTTRSEYILGLGASQFLGDLGGSSTIGTHFLKDFNFSSIRPGLEIGYRYHINQYFAVKTMFTTAMLFGNDAESKEPYRHNRNLNFRSPLLELSGQFEYFFYRNSQVGHRYHIKKAHGFSRFAVDAYLFVGFGGFYFNPQGRYLNGQWYSLRPLSTEGEGLAGGPAEYSRISFCIPLGIGAKYSISPQWTVGLEISDRVYTGTDYIDDAHGNYFDNATIYSQKGPIAAYFADPSLGEIHQIIPPDKTGLERADPTHNDTYMFTFITVSYTPPYRRRTRSKF